MKKVKDVILIILWLINYMKYQQNKVIKKLYLILLVYIEMEMVLKKILIKHLIYFKNQLKAETYNLYTIWGYFMIMDMEYNKINIDDKVSKFIKDFG